MPDSRTRELNTGSSRVRSVKRTWLRHAKELALLSVLPLVLFWVLYDHAIFLDQQQDSRQLQHLVEEVDHRTSTYFEQYRFLLRGLASHPDVRQRKEGAVSELFAELAPQFRESLNFFAATPTGAIFASGSSFGSPPPSLAAIKAFQALDEEDAGSIMELHEGVLSDQEVTGLLVPFRDMQGNFGGAIGTTLGFPELHRLWDLIPVSGHHSLMIIDQNQRIVYATNELSSSVGEPLASVPWEVRTDGDHTPDLIRFGGREYRYSLLPISSSAWQAVALAPTRGSLGEVVARHSLLLLLIPFETFIILSLILAFYRIHQRFNSYREGEVRYQELIDNTTSMIFAKNIEGRYLMVNRRFEEMFHVARNDVTRLTDFDIFPPSEAMRFRLNDQTVIQANSPVEIEEEIVQEGALHTYISTKFPLRTLDGVPYAVGCVSTDITERKRSEKMMKVLLLDAEEGREKIDAILRSIPNALLVTDNDDRVVLVSRAALRFIPTELHRIQGEKIDRLLDAPPLIDLYHKTGPGDGSPAHCDLQLKDHESAEMRTLSVSISPVIRKDGSKSGMIIVLRDVTRERESDRLKSEFISVAAHELNTPLAAIAGFTELLIEAREQGNFSETDQSDFLQTISAKCDILERIIDELLLLSRMETGRPIIIERKPANLVELARNLVDGYRRGRIDRQFFFRGAGEVMVEVDGGKIGQVLENLISNAIKYSPAAAAVIVGCDTEQDEAVLWVRDEGIGMSPEVQARVFEKFYRADTANTAIGGLGLGMSIAHSIVTSHKGSIVIISAPGEGTTVTVRLPLMLAQKRG